MKKIVFLLLMSALTLMACPQGKACGLDANSTQTAMKAVCDKTGEAKACPTAAKLGCSGKGDCKCPECAKMKCSSKADCQCPKCAQKSKPACPHCKI